MPNSQPNNPLHGTTLATIVEELEAHYGWDGLSDRIDINCFKSNPSLKSSLKLLRKTPRARSKVARYTLQLFTSKIPGADADPLESHTSGGLTVA